ncbi:MAG: hypothetical protein F4Y88_03500 [Chloroflexi bacterium]|nr:hypothetical protein [Chloroflexota bacterium]
MPRKNPNADDSPERIAARAYFRQPRQLSEHPKLFSDWVLAFLLTPVIGVVVLAIWDYDVWKRFAKIVWGATGLVLIVAVVPMIVSWVASWFS